MSFDQLKRQPLAAFCIEELGYRPDPKKDSKRWRDLHSPQGFSVLVRSQPNANGHYGFTRRDGQGGGTIIDLLKQEGWAWSKISQLAQEGIAAAHVPSQRPPASSSKARKSTPPKLSAFALLKHTPQDNYLSWRGITRETLQLFNLGATRYTATFPLFALKGGKLQLTSSIRYTRQPDGGRGKYFSTARAGSFNFMAPFHLKDLNSKLPLQTLFVFESPIDALSFCQLFPHITAQRPTPWACLALCGNPGEAFFSGYSALLDFLCPLELAYCLDSDEPGQALAERLAAVRDGARFHCAHKDWNEQLLQARKRKHPGP